MCLKILLNIAKKEINWNESHVLIKNVSTLNYKHFKKLKLHFCMQSIEFDTNEGSPVMFYLERPRRIRIFNKDVLRNITVWTEYNGRHIRNVILNFLVSFLHYVFVLKNC